MVLTHPRRRLDTHCLSTPYAVSTVNWAPDDGHGICPKHVERLTGNDKVLYKVSSCWNFLKLIHDARNDKHKHKNDNGDSFVTSRSVNSLKSCSFETSHCFLLYVRSVRWKTDCTFTKTLQFSGGLRLYTSTCWSWTFCIVWISDVPVHAGLQQGLTSPAVSNVLEYYTIAEHFVTLTCFGNREAYRPVEDQLVVGLFDTLSAVYKKPCKMETYVKYK
jgi:hypothetical protein